MFVFPISGVETWWWFPPLVSFVISFITSTAGLSGAFILLPFQVSILGYTTPGVTPTCLLFNVIAIPGGVYRLYREKRMVWPLVWTIILGTFPGLIVGVIIRVKYLFDAGPFKLFVGCVLLYIATRLFLNTFKKSEDAGKQRKNSNNFQVLQKQFSLKTITFEFNGQEYRASVPVLFCLSTLVGVVGGIYGIGGGAIIAPFLVTFYRLPIHTISGAALCSTFFTSIFGVIFYIVIGPLFTTDASSVSPDWLLGSLLGIGGFFGIYLGARLQKYLPAKLIKIILGLIMVGIAARYIFGYFQ